MPRINFPDPDEDEGYDPLDPDTVEGIASPTPANGSSTERRAGPPLHISSRKPGKGGRYQRINPQRIAWALEQSQGLISYAAKLIPMQPCQLRKYIDRSPRLRRIIADARDALVDIAELSLRRKALQGEAWAVVYALRTLGKHRGYSETESATPNSSAATVAMHNGQPVTIGGLIGALSSRQDFVEFAQHAAEKKSLPVNRDTTPVAPLIAAHLTSGDSGVSGGNGE